VPSEDKDAERLKGRFQGGGRMGTDQNTLIWYKDYQETSSVRRVPCRNGRRVRLSGPPGEKNNLALSDERKRNNADLEHKESLTRGRGGKYPLSFLEVQHKCRRKGGDNKGRDQKGKGGSRHHLKERLRGRCAT